MTNCYEFLMPRLNGERIVKDFDYYRSLVRRGVCGFIVFGGRIETVRRHVWRLQAEAELPLIIASDLERGLGQQLKGGTLFPPAMALAAAVRGNFSKSSDVVESMDLKLVRDSFNAVAKEAAYAGINTIFAPVLDINTNPKNPIISVRAFGEDEQTVSFFGCEMIRALQSNGIAACGKHFPGHGDTGVDSHIGLPVIQKGLKVLKGHELKPFRTAIDAGVKMIMLGHLKVPAIDPSGKPASLSVKAVEFLRRRMRYQGILITDALNMAGIGTLSEEEAARCALVSGVDIVLHPSNPEKIARYLRKRGEDHPSGRLRSFREQLLRGPVPTIPSFDNNRGLSAQLALKALRLQGSFRPGEKPLLLILCDDEEGKTRVFSSALKKAFPRLTTLRLREDKLSWPIRLPENSCTMVALYSETRAWKGGSASWLQSYLWHLRDKADLFISFGSPYLLDTVTRGAKMAVFWDSETAQLAAAKMISGGKTAVNR